MRNDKSHENLRCMHKIEENPVVYCMFSWSRLTHLFSFTSPSYMDIIFDLI